MPAKSGINLLPQERGGRSERVLDWMLTFGRFVVIVTELVVIVAFLLRFGLDQRLNDLYDAILNKQRYIQANKDFEVDFRSTQTRLLTVKQSIAGQINAASILTQLAQIIPTDVVLSSFVFVEGNITLTAQTPSERSFGKLVNSMLANERITDVAVQSVGTSEDGTGLQFVVTATWKNIPT